MKKYILTILMTLNVLTTNASNNFEITPIIIDFNGVEGFGDTIAAYGNYGSMLISYDDCATWKQIRIFNYGKILRIFRHNDELVSFCDHGEASVSEDGGITWQTKTLINDSIYAVIQYSDGYFIRTKKKFFTINNEFEIVNQYDFYSAPIKPYNPFMNPLNYSRSLAYFKNKLIAETDSSNFFVFDKSLNMLDTMSLGKIGIFDTTNRYLSGYWLDSDDNDFYMKLVSTNDSSYIVKCYLTKDLKSIDSVKNLSLNSTMYKIQGNKYYQLNVNEKFLNDSTKVHNSTANVFPLTIKDFSVYRNKMIIVGDGKFIETLDLIDSILKPISDAQGFNWADPPDYIGGNSYLIYSGGFQNYYPFFFRSDNDCLTMLPTLIKDSITKNFNTYTTSFRNKIKSGGKINFLGNYWLSTYGVNFESTDTCRSMTQYEKKFYIHSPSFTKNTRGNNVQTRNGNFIFIGINSININYYRTFIYTVDNNFNNICTFIDSNHVADYVYSKDTNTYLIHCADAKDSVSEILYTFNQGKSWDTIAKFPHNELMMDYQEFYFNNTNYVAFMHCDTSINGFRSCYLDILNPENLEVKRICRWKPKVYDKNYGIALFQINSDTNTVYISFQDTLFYVTDLFNRSSWKYYTFQNNGRVVNSLVKIGDRFIANYYDDSLPRSRNFFWIKPLDSALSFVDYHNETDPYFYSYPPFPIPALKAVRTKIYWAEIDIDKDEISVFDIYGNKVGGKERISIEKIDDWSGYLSWDCNGMEPGVYLIQVKHGTGNHVIKVLVAR